MRPLSSRIRPLAMAAGAALALGLAACEEQVHVRGNLPDARTLAEIKVGKSTRSQVESVLGTPSSVATFDNEVWYYIGGRVKTVSFFTPELLERKVIVVRFDKRGVVRDLNQFDASDGKDVQIVARETPTKGKELTVLRQLIGNVGRFSTPKPEADSGAPGLP